MKVYRTYKGGFIVHNTLKPFSKGHTHVNNFKTAKYLTKLVIEGTVPKKFPKYLIISLVRLSKDEKYIDKLKGEIE